MALQTQRRVTLGEHLLIRGAVRAMAGDASLASGFVFEHERPALLGMALGAGIVGACQRGSPALMGRAFVWIMAIRAGHLAGEYRVAVGQAELSLFIQVALEAGIR